jgi:hypothetical protein
VQQQLRQKRKRFQVIQFPALLTTGMHGTEHRDQERRTIRLSTPRLLVCPTTGSKLPGTPQPVVSPERNRALVTAFRSPITGTPFRASIPGSMFPTCYSARVADRLFCPFGLSAPPPVPVRPGSGRFNAFGPLQNYRPTPSAALPVSTPLWDCYIPPDQSVPPNLPPLGSPSESARFPLAPRSRFYF